MGCAGSSKIQALAFFCCSRRFLMWRCSFQPDRRVARRASFIFRPCSGWVVGWLGLGFGASSIGRRPVKPVAPPVG